MAHSKCDILCFIFAIIGVLFGISGFTMFFFVNGNVQAGIWAFFSGCYAAITLLIYGIKLFGVLHEWYGPLQLLRISLLGAVGAFASLIAAICYFSLMAYYHEKLPTPKTIRKSHFIMAMWACMTFKWSLTTAMIAKKLRRRLISSYDSL